MSTRRVFVKQTAGLTVARFVGSASKLWGLATTDAPERSDKVAGWYDRPMRWAQTGFAEDDPGNYDPGFWLDYFKRLHIDAVTLNAGGAVAFYPTQVRFHYRSKWLANMDTFGDLARSCRDMGMVVVARTDAHACHQDVYDAHPDWIMTDANGKKLRHPSDSEFWLTCPYG